MQQLERETLTSKWKSGHCTCISDFHKLKMGVSFEAITLGLETELMVAVWYRAVDIKMRLESHYGKKTTETMRESSESVGKHKKTEYLNKSSI